MSSALKNPLYRYYNCNIQCPKFISNEIQADKVSFSSYSNGIMLETGEFVNNANTFTISPQCLSGNNCCGELTVYLKNDSLFYSHVVMILVSKSNGTIPTANVVLYQNSGNVVGTTQITAAPSGTSSVLITLPAGFLCTAKWIFRGI